MDFIEYTGELNPRLRRTYRGDVGAATDRPSRRHRERDGRAQTRGPGAESAPVVYPTRGQTRRRVRVGLGSTAPPASDSSALQPTRHLARSEAR